MGVTSVRFPGGCYAPYYHFVDGIGPKDKRPKKRYRKNYDTPDHSFGTDEYIKWCRKIGADPFICVNMGTGTAEEARNWVEYCNGEEGSLWADLRIANGHREPYQVKLWGLGNEIGGNWELGYCDTAYEYVKKAREFAMAMKEADPAIQLIGCGAHFPILDGIYQVPGGRFPNPSDNWNREVLDTMFDYLDYISIHDYIGHDYKDCIMDCWKGTYYDNVPYLDVSAVYDLENSVLRLHIINRNASEPVSFYLGVTGYEVVSVKGTVFGNQPIDTVNTFEEPEKLKLHDFVNSSRLPYITVEQLSVTVLDVVLAAK